MTGQTACRRVTLFSGRVQGVGFRYTTREIAAGFDVAGCVRNLPNGQVELVAEGGAAEVEALLSAVRERFADNIDNGQSTASPATGEFAGFRIRHES